LADLQRTVYPHSGHPLAEGREQDKVSSPAKYDTRDMLQQDYTVQDCVKSLVTGLIFGNTELKPTWDFVKSLITIDRGSTGQGFN